MPGAEEYNANSNRIFCFFIQQIENSQVLRLSTKNLIQDVSSYIFFTSYTQFFNKNFKDRKKYISCKKRTKFTKLEFILKIYSNSIFEIIFSMYYFLFL